MTHTSVAMLYFWCAVPGYPVTMYSETAGVVGLSKLVPTRNEPLPASGRLFAASHAFALLELATASENSHSTGNGRATLKERSVP